MLTMYNKKKEKKYGGNSPYEIFVDQTGYFTESRKTAVIPFESDIFAIRDENGDKYFEGKVTYFGHDDCSDDDIYIADFSDLKRPGSYRVTSNGKTSALFHIGDTVYNRLLHDTSKAFYFMRCGMALEERYAGEFAHGRCHCDEAELLAEGGYTKLTGGWHDAGDYGRYVTTGACTCAHLLYAFKLFPDIFSKLELDIPESSSGFPDILSECRYELEWLLKMQRDDGAAYHKATTMRHASFIMPERDNEQMYVFTISSSATADLCAVCALAASVFVHYDEEFAKRLTRASLRAYNWLEEHPEFIGFYNPSGCDTGLYSEESDIDNRYWAAGELYSLTGEKRFHDAFLSLSASPYFDGKTFIKLSLGYGHVGGFGSLAYMVADREDRNAAVAGGIKDLFVKEAYWLRDKCLKNGYGSTLEDYEYYWGSNMALMHNGIKLILAKMLTGKREFYDCALEQMHVLLGRNAIGISYVTGYGEYRSVHPHYRPAIADGVENCVPGLVIGGPNRELSDPYAKEIVPGGTPPMKCYADDERCYSLNEVAIYWNSSAVFLLAGIEALK
ncbi:MAG: glycoside hydrolase family 9 protein [Ruminiclostridium sp.]|nr:glycoside hydrolase family 9 protein [Ruminiclostridium sp.]